MVATRMEITRIGAVSALQERYAFDIFAITGSSP